MPSIILSIATKRIKMKIPERADSPATLAIPIGPLKFFGLISPMISFLNEDITNTQLWRVSASARGIAVSKL